ncbi:MAG TPA: hypothetical protein P5132_07235 [Bacteroidales bacterium]|nr:hypothetical protein [Bacteroidales bacterium]
MYLLLFAFIASSTFVACDDDSTPSPFKRVKLGAQDNTTVGGFYSFSKQKVYTLEQAFADQVSIDLICFYEVYKDNFTTIASPGATIRDIFAGDYDFTNWDTTKTTYLYQLTDSVFSITQFASLTENDATIQSLYNDDEANRKAKDLHVNDIYSFKTEDNQYGIFRVVSVVPDSIGSVEIEYIIKK